MKPFPRDIAQNTDRKARARKRMPVNNVSRNMQNAPDRADFIFEKFPERFDQFEFHPFRKPAYIMVRLNGGSRPAVERYGFDHVRIKRALGQKRDMAQFVRLPFKHADKKPADDFPFFLRIFNSA